MKNFIIFLSCLLVLVLIYCYVSTADNRKINSNNSDNVDETVADVDFVDNTINMSENEYKTQCEEFYNDDFFDNEPSVNQFVKFEGFISGRYEYTNTSTIGIIIEDVRDKYDLDKRYLGCCVMHKETKDDAIPSYVGDSLYLLFNNDYSLNFDNYKEGQKIYVYGQIIQNKNGIWIMPKYIDVKGD